MASEITNKTSQKFKGKQKCALLLDDSAYLSSEIFCNFSMPIIAKCQPLHRTSILVADYNQKVTIYRTIQNFGGRKLWRNGSLQ